MPEWEWEVRWENTFHTYYEGESDKCFSKGETRPTWAIISKMGKWKILRKSWNEAQALAKYWGTSSKYHQPTKTYYYQLKGRSHFWSLMSRGRGWRCPCGNQSRQAACACAATSPRDSTQPLAAIWGTSWYSLVLLSTFWYFLVLLGASWYWVLSVLWGDSTQALASNQPEPPLKCCYCAFLLIRLDILPVTVQLNFSHLSAVHNCTSYTVCLCLCLCCVFVCLCLRVCVFVSVCCAHLLYTTNFSHLSVRFGGQAGSYWSTTCSRRPPKLTS